MLQRLSRSGSLCVIYNQEALDEIDTALLDLRSGHRFQFLTDRSQLDKSLLLSGVRVDERPLLQICRCRKLLTKLGLNWWFNRTDEPNDFGDTQGLLQALNPIAWPENDV
jgi:hypothetical protein